MGINIEDTFETEKVYEELNKINPGECFKLHVSEISTYNKESLTSSIKYANEIRAFFMIRGLVGYTINLSTNNFDTDEEGCMTSIKLNFYKHKKRIN